MLSDRKPWVLSGRIPCQCVLKKKKKKSRTLFVVSAVCRLLVAYVIWERFGLVGHMRQNCLARFGQHKIASRCRWSDWVQATTTCCETTGALGCRLGDINTVIRKEGVCREWKKHRVLRREKKKCEERKIHFLSLHCKLRCTQWHIRST